MRLSFYICDSNYIDYLRLYDNRVPQVDKGVLAFKRPLVGIVLEIDGNKFYAPLSSPKAKHLSMKNSRDFIKIDSGNLGVINLNNMIPVLDKYAQEIDIIHYPIRNKQDLDYVNLLANQLTWCNSNKENIKAKAESLYNIFKDGLANENLRERCCDFELLIEKSKDYGNPTKSVVV